MLTDHERSQLENEYRREPRSIIGLLVTCAAGLAIVVALVLVGIDIRTYGGDDATRQTVTRVP
jgi:hypothetical protein